MKRVILAAAAILTIGVNSAFATGGSGITPDVPATQPAQRHADFAPVATPRATITMSDAGSVRIFTEQPGSGPNTLRIPDPMQTYLNYQRSNPLMGGGG